MEEEFLEFEQLIFVQKVFGFDIVVADKGISHINKLDGLNIQFEVSFSLILHRFVVKKLKKLDDFIEGQLSVKDEIFNILSKKLL